jgi:hypothetical protein
VDGNVLAVGLDNCGSLVAGELSFEERRWVMGDQQTKLDAAMGVLAPEIRAEIDALLQQVEDLDALSTATLLYGFMGLVDGGDLSDLDTWHGITLSPAERDDLKRLLPAVARILERNPAFLRLRDRILITAPDRSWQIALCHLYEALEALRRVKDRVLTDDQSGPPPDMLATIEYIERNVFPAWKEKLRQQAPRPYQRYLQTEHWRRTRMEVLSRARYRCELCGVNDRLEVHHKHYESLWNEALDDLIALCRACHDKVHQVEVHDETPADWDYSDL